MTERPCSNCGHGENDHDGYGGMCDGYGFNESRTVCGCQEFCAALPYPENPGQTHYEGCERERGHHNCALAKLAEATARAVRCEGRVSDLEQDRSDLWRCLGIPQDADVDAAIAAIIALRA